MRIMCALQANPDPRKYATYLATRPPKFEQDAAHMLLEVLLDEHIPPTRGFFLHIAHLGDASNVEGFRVGAVGCKWGVKQHGAAQRSTAQHGAAGAPPQIHNMHTPCPHTHPQAVSKRLPLSVETCPHYLLFSAENIPDGDTRFKVKGAAWATAGHTHRCRGWCVSGWIWRVSVKRAAHMLRDPPPLPNDSAPRRCGTRPTARRCWQPWQPATSTSSAATTRLRRQI
jgi:hypothetical protein